MKKFAFIGAGSLQFTSKTVKDLLTFDAFKECEIALMDTNEYNLNRIYDICDEIKTKMGCPKCVITKTMDRHEALKGADGVLCTVFNGDVDIWRHEIEIPKN